MCFVGRACSASLARCIRWRDSSPPLNPACHSRSRSSAISAAAIWPQLGGRMLSEAAILWSETSSTCLWVGRTVGVGTRERQRALYQPRVRAASAYSSSANLEASSTEASRSRRQLLLQRSAGPPTPSSPPRSK